MFRGDLHPLLFTQPWATRPSQHGVEAGLRLCYGHPCATPELMQRWNLNLTVPFADWRLGTTYRGPPPR
jgi:hypothetical protein